MPPNLPVYKVTIVGDGAVGKTSLIRRYCEGKFEISRVATIGVDFQTKIIELPSGPVKLSIWDMAGQPHFKSVRSGFYGGSCATALVFDVTQPQSLANLEGWRQEVLNARARQRFLLVGNKIDLPHPAGTRPLEFAASIDACYFRTSALNALGVEAMFTALAELALPDDATSEDS